MRMATVKIFLVVTTICSGMLLSAGSAHVRIIANRLSANRIASNKLSANGITAPVSRDETLGIPLSEGLPFHSISQSGLGKPSFAPRTP